MTAAGIGGTAGGAAYNPTPISEAQIQQAVANLNANTLYQQQVAQAQNAAQQAKDSGSINGTSMLALTGPTQEARDDWQWIQDKYPDWNKPSSAPIDENSERRKYLWLAQHADELKERFKDFQAIGGIIDWRRGAEAKMDAVKLTENVLRNMTDEDLDRYIAGLTVPVTEAALAYGLGSGGGGGMGGGGIPAGGQTLEHGAIGFASLNPAAQMAAGETGYTGPGGLPQGLGSPSLAGYNKPLVANIEGNQLAPQFVPKAVYGEAALQHIGADPFEGVNLPAQSKNDIATIAKSVYGVVNQDTVKSVMDSKVDANAKVAFQDNSGNKVTVTLNDTQGVKGGTVTDYAKANQPIAYDLIQEVKRMAIQNKPLGRDVDLSPEGLANTLFSQGFRNAASSFLGTTIANRIINENLLENKLSVYVKASQDAIRDGKATTYDLNLAKMYQDHVGDDGKVNWYGLGERMKATGYINDTKVTILQGDKTYGIFDAPLDGSIVTNKEINVKRMQKYADDNNSDDKTYQKGKNALDSAILESINPYTGFAKEGNKLGLVGRVFGAPVGTDPSIINASAPGISMVLGEYGYAFRSPTDPLGRLMVMSTRDKGQVMSWNQFADKYPNFQLSTKLDIKFVPTLNMLPTKIEKGEFIQSIKDRVDQLVNDKVITDAEGKSVLAQLITGQLEGGQGETYTFKGGKLDSVKLYSGQKFTLKQLQAMYPNIPVTIGSVTEKTFGIGAPTDTGLSYALDTLAKADPNYPQNVAIVIGIWNTAKARGQDPVLAVNALVKNDEVVNRATAMAQKDNIYGFKGQVFQYAVDENTNLTTPKTITGIPSVSQFVPPVGTSWTVGKWTYTMEQDGTLQVSKPGKTSFFAHPDTTVYNEGLRNFQIATNIKYQPSTITETFTPQLDAQGNPIHPELGVMSQKPIPEKGELKHIGQQIITFRQPTGFGEPVGAEFFPSSVKIGKSEEVGGPKEARGKVGAYFTGGGIVRFTPLDKRQVKVEYFVEKDPDGKFGTLWVKEEKGKWESGDIIYDKMRKAVTQIVCTGKSCQLHEDDLKAGIEYLQKEGWKEYKSDELAPKKSPAELGVMGIKPVPEKAELIHFDEKGYYRTINGERVPVDIKGSKVSPSIGGLFGEAAPVQGGEGITGKLVVKPVEVPGNSEQGLYFWGENNVQYFMPRKLGSDANKTDTLTNKFYFSKDGKTWKDLTYSWKGDIAQVYGDCSSEDCGMHGAQVNAALKFLKSGWPELNKDVMVSTGVAPIPQETEGTGQGTYVVAGVKNNSPYLLPVTAESIWTSINSDNTTTLQIGSPSCEPCRTQLEDAGNFVNEEATNYPKSQYIYIDKTSDEGKRLFRLHPELVPQGESIPVTYVYVKGVRQIIDPMSKSDQVVGNQSQGMLQYYADRFGGTGKPYVPPPTVIDVSGDNKQLNLSTLLPDLKDTDEAILQLGTTSCLACKQQLAEADKLIRVWGNHNKNYKYITIDVTSPDFLTFVSNLSPEDRVYFTITETPKTLIVKNGVIKHKIDDWQTYEMLNFALESDGRISKKEYVAPPPDIPKPPPSIPPSPQPKPGSGTASLHLQNPNIKVGTNPIIGADADHTLDFYGDVAKQYKGNVTISNVRMFPRIQTDDSGKVIAKYTVVQFDTDKPSYVGLKLCGGGCEDLGSRIEKTTSHEIVINNENIGEGKVLTGIYATENKPDSIYDTFSSLIEDNAKFTATLISDYDLKTKDDLKTISSGFSFSDYHAYPHTTYFLPNIVVPMKTTRLSYSESGSTKLVPIVDNIPGTTASTITPPVSPIVPPTPSVPPKSTEPVLPTVIKSTDTLEKANAEKRAQILSIEPKNQQIIGRDSLGQVIVISSSGMFLGRYNTIRDYETGSNFGHCDTGQCNDRDVAEAEQVIADAKNAGWKFTGTPTPKPVTPPTPFAPPKPVVPPAPAQSTESIGTILLKSGETVPLSLYNTLSDTEKAKVDKDGMKAVFAISPTGQMLRNDAYLPQYMDEFKRGGSDALDKALSKDYVKGGDGAWMPKEVREDKQEPETGINYKGAVVGGFNSLSKVAQEIYLTQGYAEMMKEKDKAQSILLGQGYGYMVKGEMQLDIPQIYRSGNEKLINYAKLLYPEEAVSASLKGQITKMPAINEVFTDSKLIQSVYGKIEWNKVGDVFAYIGESTIGSPSVQYTAEKMFFGTPAGGSHTERDANIKWVTDLQLQGKISDIDAVSAVAKLNAPVPQNATPDEYWGTNIIKDLKNSGAIPKDEADKRLGFIESSNASEEAGLSVVLRNAFRSIPAVDLKTYMTDPVTGQRIVSAGIYYDASVKQYRPVPAGNYVEQKLDAKTGVLTDEVKTLPQGYEVIVTGKDSPIVTADGMRIKFAEHRLAQIGEKPAWYGEAEGPFEAMLMNEQKMTEEVMQKLPPVVWPAFAFAKVAVDLGFKWIGLIPLMVREKGVQVLKGIGVTIQKEGEERESSAVANAAIPVALAAGAAVWFLERPKAVMENPLMEGPYTAGMLSPKLLKAVGYELPKAIGEGAYEISILATPKLYEKLGLSPEAIRKQVYPSIGGEVAVAGGAARANVLSVEPSIVLARYNKSEMIGEVARQKMQLIQNVMKDIFGMGINTKIKPSGVKEEVYMDAEGTRLSPDKRGVDNWRIENKVNGDVAENSQGLVQLSSPDGKDRVWIRADKARLLNATATSGLMLERFAGELTGGRDLYIADTSGGVAYRKPVFTQRIPSMHQMGTQLAHWKQQINTSADAGGFSTDAFIPIDPVNQNAPFPALFGSSQMPQGFGQRGGGEGIMGLTVLFGKNERGVEQMPADVLELLAQGKLSDAKKLINEKIDRGEFDPYTIYMVGKYMAATKFPELENYAMKGYRGLFPVPPDSIPKYMRDGEIKTAVWKFKSQIDIAYMPEFRQAEGNLQEGWYYKDRYIGKNQTEADAWYQKNVPNTEYKLRVGQPITWIFLMTKQAIEDGVKPPSYAQIQLMNLESFKTDLRQILSGTKRREAEPYETVTSPNRYKLEAMKLYPGPMKWYDVETHVPTTGEFKGLEIIDRQRPNEPAVRGAKSKVSGEKREVVSTTLFTSDRAVLVGHTSSVEPANWFSNFGGKAEPKFGSSFEESALGELKEELNLDIPVRDVNYAGVYRGVRNNHAHEGNREYTVYLDKAPDWLPKPSKEMDVVAKIWFDADGKVSKVVKVERISPESTEVKVTEYKELPSSWKFYPEFIDTLQGNAYRMKQVKPDANVPTNVDMSQFKIAKSSKEFGGDIRTLLSKRDTDYSKRIQEGRELTRERLGEIALQRREAYNKLAQTMIPPKVQMLIMSIWKPDLNGNMPPLDHAIASAEKMVNQAHTRAEAKVKEQGGDVDVETEKEIGKIKVEFKAPEPPEGHPYIIDRDTQAVPSGADTIEKDGYVFSNVQGISLADVFKKASKVDNLAVLFGNLGLEKPIEFAQNALDNKLDAQSRSAIAKALGVDEVLLAQTFVNADKSVSNVWDALSSVSDVNALAKLASGKLNSLKSENPAVNSWFKGFSKQQKEFRQHTYSDLVNLTTDRTVSSQQRFDNVINTAINNAELRNKILDIKNGILTMEQMSGFLKSTYRSMIWDKRISTLTDSFEIVGDAVRNSTKETFENVRPVVLDAIKDLKDTLPDMQRALTAVGQFTGNTAKTIARQDAFRLMGESFGIVGDALKNATTETWENVKPVVLNALKDIEGVLPDVRDALIEVGTVSQKVAKYVARQDAFRMMGESFGIVNDAMKNATAETWDNVKPVMLNALQDMKDTLPMVAESLSDLGTVVAKQDAIRMMGESFSIVSDAIQNASKETYENIKPLVLDTVQNMKDTLPDVANAVLSVGEGTVKVAQTVARQDAFRLMGESFGIFGDAVQNASRETIDNIKPVILNALKDMQDTLPDVRDAIFEVGIGAVKGAKWVARQDAIRMMGESFGIVNTALRTATKENWESVKPLIIDALNNMKQVWPDVVDAMGEVGKGTVVVAKTVARQDAFRLMGESFGIFSDAIQNASKETYDNVKPLILDELQNIKDTWPDVQDAMTAVGEFTVDKAKLIARQDAIRMMGESFGIVNEALQNATKENWDNVKPIILRALTDMKGSMPALAEGVADLAKFTGRGIVAGATLLARQDAVRMMGESFGIVNEALQNATKETWDNVKPVILNALKDIEGTLPMVGESLTDLAKVTGKTAVMIARQDAFRLMGESFGIVNEAMRTATKETIENIKPLLQDKLKDMRETLPMVGEVMKDLGGAVATTAIKVEKTVVERPIHYISGQITNVLLNEKVARELYRLENILNLGTLPPYEIYREFLMEYARRKYTLEAQKMKEAEAKASEVKPVETEGMKETPKGNVLSDAIDKLKSNSADAVRSAIRDIDGMLNLHPVGDPLHDRLWNVYSELTDRLLTLTETKGAKIEPLTDKEWSNLQQKAFDKKSWTDTEKTQYIDYIDKEVRDSEGEGMVVGKYILDEKVLRDVYNDSKLLGGLGSELSADIARALGLMVEKVTRPSTEVVNYLIYKDTPANKARAEKLKQFDTEPPISDMEGWVQFHRNVGELYGYTPYEIGKYIEFKTQVGLDVLKQYAPDLVEAIIKQETKPVEPSIETAPQIIKGTVDEIAQQLPPLKEGYIRIGHKTDPETARIIQSTELTTGGQEKQPFILQTTTTEIGRYGEGKDVNEYLSKSHKEAGTSTVIFDIPIEMYNAMTGRVKQRPSVMTEGEVPMPGGKAFGIQEIKKLSGNYVVAIVDAPKGEVSSLRVFKSKGDIETAPKGISEEFKSRVIEAVKDSDIGELDNLRNENQIGFRDTINDASIQKELQPTIEKTDFMAEDVKSLYKDYGINTDKSAGIDGLVNKIATESGFSPLSGNKINNDVEYTGGLRGANATYEVVGDKLSIPNSSVVNAPDMVVAVIHELTHRDLMRTRWNQTRNVFETIQSELSKKYDKDTINKALEITDELMAIEYTQRITGVHGKDYINDQYTELKNLLKSEVDSKYVMRQVAEYMRQLNPKRVDIDILTKSLTGDTNFDLVIKQNAENYGKLAKIANELLDEFHDKNVSNADIKEYPRLNDEQISLIRDIVNGKREPTLTEIEAISQQIRDVDSKINDIFDEEVGEKYGIELEKQQDRLSFFQNILNVKRNEIQSKVGIREQYHSQKFVPPEPEIVRLDVPAFDAVSKSYVDRKEFINDIKTDREGSKWLVVLDEYIKFADQGKKYSEDRIVQLLSLIGELSKNWRESVESGEFSKSDRFDALHRKMDIPEIYEKFKLVDDIAKNPSKYTRLEKVVVLEDIIGSLHSGQLIKISDIGSLKGDIGGKLDAVGASIWDALSVGDIRSILKENNVKIDLASDIKAKEIKKPLSKKIEEDIMKEATSIVERYREGEVGYRPAPEKFEKGKPSITPVEKMKVMAEPEKPISGEVIEPMPSIESFTKERAVTETVINEKGVTEKLPSEKPYTTYKGTEAPTGGYPKGGGKYPTSGKQVEKEIIPFEKPIGEKGITIPMMYKGEGVTIKTKHGDKYITQDQLDSAIAWRQGFVYRFWFKPFHQKDMIVTRTPIKGVQYKEGVRSAYDSAVILYGGEIPEGIKRTMGVVNISAFRSPDKTKPILHFDEAYNKPKKERHSHKELPNGASVSQVKTEKPKPKRVREVNLWDY